MSDLTSKLRRTAKSAYAAMDIDLAERDAIVLAAALLDRYEGSAITITRREFWEAAQEIAPSFPWHCEKLAEKLFGPERGEKNVQEHDDGDDNRNRARAVGQNDSRD